MDRDDDDENADQAAAPVGEKPQADRHERGPRCEANTTRTDDTAGAPAGAAAAPRGVATAAPAAGAAEPPPPSRRKRAPRPSPKTRRRPRAAGTSPDSAGRSPKTGRTSRPGRTPTDTERREDRHRGKNGTGENESRDRPQTRPLRTVRTFVSFANTETAAQNVRPGRPGRQETMLQAGQSPGPRPARPVVVSLRRNAVRSRGVGITRVGRP